MSEKEKLAVEAIRALFQPGTSDDMLKLIGSAKDKVYTAIREKDDQLHALRLAVIRVLKESGIDPTFSYVHEDDIEGIKNLIETAGIHFENGQWILKEGE